MFAAMDKAYRHASIAAGISKVPRVLLERSFNDIVVSLELKNDEESPSLGTNKCGYGTGQSTDRSNNEPIVLLSCICGPVLSYLTCVC